MPRTSLCATAESNSRKPIEQLTVNDITSNDCSKVELHILNQQTDRVLKYCKEMRIPYDISNNCITVPLGNSWKGLVQLFASIWVSLEGYSNMLKALLMTPEKNKKQFIAYIMLDSQLAPHTLLKNQNVEQLRLPAFSPLFIRSDYADSSIHLILKSLLPLSGLFNE